LETAFQFHPGELKKLDVHGFFFRKGDVLLMVQKSCKPVEVGSLSHHLQGLMHPRWLALGFLPSTVGVGFKHWLFSKLACGDGPILKKNATFQVG